MLSGYGGSLSNLHVRHHHNELSPKPNKKVQRSESCLGTTSLVSGSHHNKGPFLRTNSSQKKLTREAKPKNLIAELSQEIIGEDQIFNGPFGLRKALYLDQTASGRSIRCIEDFITQNVLPVYGNTHTTTSFFASEMSNYREEARTIIRNSCGANCDDEIIFCGSGATAAVNKLVHSIQKPGEHPPTILIGPFEHHSNILPWRELTTKIINIPEDSFGRLDIHFLERVLKKLASKRSLKKRKIIGVFSASSNVTGALTDDVSVTALMHSYDGWAFWDYAAAAPHVKISMNPATDSKRLDFLSQKDALFFSGHKFIGGPQTPGVLIAKRHVFQNPVSHGVGGGTVLFVTKRRHKYLSSIHEREEGGTPEIVGSIRLGLVFQMKNEITDEVIMAREAEYTRRALDVWGRLPEIQILGHKHNPRIPVISLMIKHLRSGYFLHHDFVVALLNDLFGIQCRGGCMCAGPYSQQLLGINEDLAVQYENILCEPRKPVEFLQKPEFDMIFKPGFVRVSLPFHASSEEIDYLIDAVRFVADHGWKLVPLYKCSFANGTFRFSSSHAPKPHRPIKSFTLTEHCQNDSSIHESYSSPHHHPYESCFSYQDCLKFAETCLIANIQRVLFGLKLIDETQEILPSRRSLRWFLLPSEALQCLQVNDNNNTPKPGSIPNELLIISSPKPFAPKDDYKQLERGDRLLKRFLPGSIPHFICSTPSWLDEDRIAHQNEIHQLQILNKMFTKNLRWQNASHSHSSLNKNPSLYCEQDEDQDDEEDRESSFNNDHQIIIPNDQQSSSGSSGYHEGVYDLTSF